MILLNIAKFPLRVPLQVAEKILDNKELEFYKWDGNLKELLQNVREKLNKVAEVISYCYSHLGLLQNIHSVPSIQSLFIYCKLIAI